MGVGQVGTKFESDWPSEALWNGTSATLLYTVTNFTSVSVPKAAVNRIFDYGESYTPQSLIRVADTRVENRPEAIQLALEKYSDTQSS